jgi:hypothetical protein
VQNFQIHKQGLKIQECPSSVGVLQPYVNSSNDISLTSLRRRVLTRFAVEIFSSLNARKQKNTTNELLMRTNFQRFPNQAPRSSFKKIVVSMPSLLQGLHLMSLLKSVPEGLKPQECEHTKLREPPPVSYVPMKDEVQKEVSRLRNLEIKTTIKKDTTLNFPVWQGNGMREAFLMHVTALLDAIKKRGHFYDYKKAEKVHKEARKAVESARAGLALLDGTGTKSKWFCKKEAREAAEKALAKAQDSKSEAREAKEASEVNDNSMKAGFLDDLEKPSKPRVLPRVR